MHFLLFGSAWFWIVLLVAIVLMMTATEKGSGVGATLTFVLAIAVFWLFGNGDSFQSLFSYGIAHPWSVISIILIYFILGTCWAILKWYFFLLAKRDKIKEEKSSYVYAPRVSDHKSDILTWMFYWPFSIIWTAVDHPVKRLFLFIYNRIKSRMQAMSDKIFASVINETEEREKKKARERLEEIEERKRQRSGI